MGAEELVKSRQQHKIELLGPAKKDSTWQAKSNEGYAAACFAIDWEAQQAVCPQGHVSRVWRPRKNHRGNDAIEIRFDKKDCDDCPVRSRCTRSSNHPRMLNIKPQAQHAALQNARLYQQTEAFKLRYAARAGVEGTISQGTRSFELRRARYRGLVKTSLQHVLIAAAINLTRAVAWIQNRPLAKTRRSHFAALAPASST